MNIYRQGDVLIIRDDSARPGEPIERENGRVVLAHGELTGHAHAIKVRGCYLYRCEGSEVDRVLKVTSRLVALEHEEHDTIMLPHGTYRVRIQRKYAPEANRNVQD
jgi:hypothetical protein